MKVGSLRYPGGEKADTYFYSPGPDFWPPRKGQSQPTLSRQSPDDWPSNDPVFYNQSEKKWANPPMTFDEFMDICDKVKAEPYIVIAVVYRRFWGVHYVCVFDVVSLRQSLCVCF
jgi:hypothetical protein